MEKIVYTHNKEKRRTDLQKRLLDICERIESGGETTTAERYFYYSLSYFQDRNGNDGAINEFLNVAQAAGLL